MKAMENLPTAEAFLRADGRVADLKRLLVDLGSAILVEDHRQAALRSSIAP
jgi:hypothetical protein